MIKINTNYWSQDPELFFPTKNQTKWWELVILEYWKIASNKKKKQKTKVRYVLALLLIV